MFRALLGNSLLSEILKLMTASEMHLKAYRFRDQQMHEAPIVLERDDAMTAGIEIKAAARVSSRDLAALRNLVEAC